MVTSRGEFNVLKIRATAVDLKLGQARPLRQIANLLPEHCAFGIGLTDDSSGYDSAILYHPACMAVWPRPTRADMMPDTYRLRVMAEPVK